MLRRRLALLILLLASTFGAMLSSPVLATVAHSGVVAAEVEAMEAHGHAHDGDLAERHNAVDHAHDIPHVSAHAISLSLKPAAGWSELTPFAVAPALALGLERPPRPHP